MTKKDLKKRLDEAGVYEEAYSLDGGLPSERYVLSQDPNGRWSVYYSERGERTGLRVFDLESEATTFFLAQVLEDRTTRQRSSC